MLLNENPGILPVLSINSTELWLCLGCVFFSNCKMLLQDWVGFELNFVLSEELLNELYQLLRWLNLTRWSTHYMGIKFESPNWWTDSGR